MHYASPDFVGFAVLDTMEVQYINPAGRKMVGIGPDEDVTRFTVPDFHPESAMTLIAESAIPESRRTGEWRGEIEFLHRDGKEIPASMLLMYHPSPDGKPDLISTISRDIRQELAAKEALRKQEETLRSFLDHAPMIMGLVDVHDDDLIPVYYNQATARFWGVSDEELIRKSARESGLPPDHIALWVSKYREAERTGAPVEFEYEQENPAGPRQLVATASFIGRISDTVTRCSCIIQDITDRRALEAQLNQSQKMESVGRLAGGVAHDFNNLLTVINSYATLGLEASEPEDPLHGNLEQILEAGERAASLTSQLLAFSRKQMMEPRFIDLNDTIHNLEKMLRRLIGEDIELETDLEEDLGLVLADPVQLEQVVMNLAVNSRDAMETGGRLTIGTASFDLEESTIWDDSAMEAGSYVILSVSDTGMGMDEDTRQHIFEPFFTTKGLAKGTGLGLSMVYGTIKQSGGYILVDSEPDQGTSISIYLPRLTGEMMDEEHQILPVLRGNGETIMVVEDEEAVRELTTKILQTAGYQVHSAVNGVEARKEIEKADYEFDLLLTDVVMPLAGGRELADGIGAIAPDVKVLYMSGYTDDTILQHGVLDPDVNFIAKPYSIADLLNMVRRILDD